MAELTTSDLFQVINTTNRIIISRKHGHIDLRNLTRETAKALWDDGFGYLALTNAGARHYYPGLRAAEVVKLIENSRRAEDVIAFSSLSKASSVTDAMINRLASLAG